MKSAKNNFRRNVVIGTATGLAALGFWASQAFYTVSEVIDGDTFKTTEKQIVRLDSINAPELNYCLGPEAKEELSKLILNKKVYLKVTYINGMRLVSSVYTFQGNVGQIMLAKGMATFTDKGTQKGNGLLQTAQKARQEKLGVYSEKCTQLENLKNPKCNIKANTRNGHKYFRTPNCSFYNKTIVQLHEGDTWFCAAQEAQKAGYSKAPDCK